MAMMRLVAGRHPFDMKEWANGESANRRIGNGRCINFEGVLA